MERLTKKNDSGGYYYPKCFEKCNGLGASSKCDNCEIMTSVCEKLGEFEDLEEQGLLLRLPCKVGTKVYAINIIIDYGEIGDAATYSYYINEREFQIYMMMDYEKLVFGKTLFLTRAEAEVKLKELRGGENER